MGKNYHSFLLRCWQVQVDGKHVWRASLENPFTRERKGFATLSELTAYLETQISDEDDNCKKVPD